MLPVIILIIFITVVYVIISDINDKRKESKGICKTTGGSCTSPTGCNCGDVFNDKPVIK